MRKSPGQTHVEVHRRDDGSVTAYIKLKTSENEILSKFYENGEEIDPLKYEGKSCDVKATLAIEGLVVGNNVNLHVRIHDANVRPKTYEHVRLVDLEWWKAERQHIIPLFGITCFKKKLILCVLMSNELKDHYVII